MKQVPRLQKHLPQCLFICFWSAHPVNSNRLFSELSNQGRLTSFFVKQSRDMITA